MIYQCGSDWIVMRLLMLVLESIPAFRSLIKFLCYFPHSKFVKT